MTKVTIRKETKGKKWLAEMLCIAGNSGKNSIILQVFIDHDGHFATDNEMKILWTSIYNFVRDCIELKNY